LFYTVLKKKIPQKGYVSLLKWDSAPEHLKPFLPQYGQVEDLRSYPIPNFDLLIDATKIGNGNQHIEVEFTLLSTFEGFKEIEEEDLTFNRMETINVDNQDTNISWWQKIKKRLFK
jgi:hypothetical protein